MGKQQLLRGQCMGRAAVLEVLAGRREGREARPRQVELGAEERHGLGDEVLLVAARQHAEVLDERDDEHEVHGGAGLWDRRERHGD